MSRKKKLVIVGAGEHGRMMHNFFSMHSDFNIVAFAEEKKYRKTGVLLGLPVVNFEDLKELYCPSENLLFIAISYVNLNKERTRIYFKAKGMGYRFATFVDPSSVIDRTATIGENVAIFENSSVQYGAKIGNNTVIQAGVCIAHSTEIKGNVWIAPNVAVAGFVKIGENSFLGINSTVINSVSIAENVIIGAGTVVTKSIYEVGVYAGNPFKCINKDVSGYLMI